MQTENDEDGVAAEETAASSCFTTEELTPKDDLLNMSHTGEDIKSKDTEGFDFLGVTDTTALASEDNAATACDVQHGRLVERRLSDGATLADGETQLSGEVQNLERGDCLPEVDPNGKQISLSIKPDSATSNNSGLTGAQHHNQASSNKVLETRKAADVSSGLVGGFDLFGVKDTTALASDDTAATACGGLHGRLVGRRLCGGATLAAAEARLSGEVHSLDSGDHWPEADPNGKQISSSIKSDSATPNNFGLTGAQHQNQAISNKVLEARKAADSFGLPGSCSVTEELTPKDDSLTIAHTGEDIKSNDTGGFDLLGVKDTTALASDDTAATACDVQHGSSVGRRLSDGATLAAAETRLSGEVQSLDREARWPEADPNGKQISSSIEPDSATSNNSGLTRAWHHNPAISNKALEARKATDIGSSLNGSCSTTEENLKCKGSKHILFNKMNQRMKDLINDYAKKKKKREEMIPRVEQEISDVRKKIAEREQIPKQGYDFWLQYLRVEVERKENYLIRKHEHFSDLHNYLGKNVLGWNSTSQGQQYFQYIGHCYNPDHVRLFKILRLLAPAADFRVYVNFMVLGVSTIAVVREVDELQMDFVDDGNAECIIKSALQACGCGFPFPDKDLYILSKAYRSWLERNDQ